MKYDSVSLHLGGLTLNVYNLPEMPSAVTTKSNGIQGSNSESKSVPVAVLFVLHGRFGHSQDKSTNDLIQTILEYSNHAGRNGKHLS